jgi:hypothetical protein
MGDVLSEMPFYRRRVNLHANVIASSSLTLAFHLGTRRVARVHALGIVMPELGFVADEKTSHPGRAVKPGIGQRLGMRSA